MMDMAVTTTTTTTTKLPPHQINLSNETILHLLNTKCIASLQHLKEVHAIVIKNGHIQDHYVSGTLLKCYTNPHFTNLDFAVRVFEYVPNPNVFVWNVILKGCLDYNEPFKALCLYHDMVVISNSRPNKFTYAALFNACTGANAVEEGFQVHAQVVKHGFSRDKHIISAGIRMYSSFGLVNEARGLLDERLELDIACWNAMIDGYFKCGDAEAAKELFDRMPNKSIGSWNVMVSGFARYGMIAEAKRVFSLMQERNEISWSAMIDGYIGQGLFKDALEVFSQMQKEGIKPTKFVLSSILSACANVGALDQGRWIHTYVRRSSIRLDAVLGTALIDMYAKCSQLDMAWEVFEDMKEKEIFTWNAMIYGLGMHGRAEDSIKLFDKMQKERLRPNAITFVGVLTACAHGGLVDKGLRILNNMEKVYGIEPEIEHYGCVVDLLGRAGRLDEAEEFIRCMPVRPNAAVWGALLNACRIHGNAEVGERAGKILIGLEPENSGRYVLLSNIYAKAGRWDDVTKVRELMKERGVKTVTGCSMIDLGGKVHEFKIGDGSHPQKEEIYSTLDKVIARLKMEGYSPDTSQVLLDIKEEEKENAIRYHSEKLAIAFGLINTMPGSTIRIVKNLRVCEDCHAAAKLISRVYDREIILRDRVRYHHFINGSCSCNDFW